MPIRHTLAAAALAAGVLTATPALAEGGDESFEHTALPPLPDGPAAGPGPIAAYSVEEREAWLSECRDRMSGGDDGVGGAIIGGVIGGIAGNRIAGRGDRVVGTVIGAGVGAVAGAAIDRAEDGGARDFCEDYLARYEHSYAGAGAGFAYGHTGMMKGHFKGAYGDPYFSGRVMWVPVKISGGCKPKCGCDEEVVEEWIEETPPPARRVIPTKRVPIKPTKTVPAKPTKYTK